MKLAAKTRLPVGHRIPAWLRVRGSICVQLVVLALVAVLALAPTAAAGPGGSGAGLLLLVVSGVATAVLESSIFGCFSAFPSEWNGAVVSGQGLAGLVASVILVATKAAAAGAASATAVAVYCGLGGGVLLACLVAHVALMRLPAVRELLAAAAAGGGGGGGSGDAGKAAGGSAAAAAGAGAGAGAVGPAELPAPARDGAAAPHTWAVPEPPGLVGGRLEAYTAAAAREGASGGAAGAPPPPAAAATPSSQWQRLNAVRQMSTPGGTQGEAMMAAAAAASPPPGAGAGGAAPRAALNPFNVALDAAAGGASLLQPASTTGGDGGGGGEVPPAQAAQQQQLAATARLSLLAARRQTAGGGGGCGCGGGRGGTLRGALEAAHSWGGELRRVLFAVATPALALLLNFVATFLPFPALLATIGYRGDVPGAVVAPFASDATWWFAVLLLVFSVFDVVGRSAANAHAPVPAPLLPAYALARLGWTPLVAGCAYRWAPAFGDALLVAVVAGFAFTNGHLATLCFRQGPQAAAPRDRELAGFVLTAALHVGIVVGSNLALVFTTP